MTAYLYVADVKDCDDAVMFIAWVNGSTARANRPGETMVAFNQAALDLLADQLPGSVWWVDARGDLAADSTITLHTRDIGVEESFAVRRVPVDRLICAAPVVACGKPASATAREWDGTR